jgi:hypothetical protein
MFPFHLIYWMPTRILEVQPTSVRHSFLASILIFSTSMLASIPPSTPPFCTPFAFPNAVRQPLLAESYFCQPFILVARWQLVVVSWTRSADTDYPCHCRRHQRPCFASSFLRPFRRGQWRRKIPINRLLRTHYRGHQ